LKLQSHKTVLVIVGLICILILVVAIIGSIWPKQEEWFFELGLLGKNKTADAYFSNENSIAEVGALNTWFIYVYNHMGTTQNVSIKSKLLNSSMKLPDDQTHQPSNVTTLEDFPVSLSANETVLIPFFWNIVEAERQNNSTIIDGIMINNNLFEVQISDSNSTFTIIFELWVENSNGQYSFEWDSRNGVSSASIYMGFKVLNDP
jgi:uncharacterized membrane protein